MSDPEALEKWVVRGIIVLTFAGTFWLSVSNKPATAFAIVSLGVLLLLHFGGDIARVTLNMLGVEATIERAERAEQGALKAAQEAQEAIKVLKQLGLHLSKSVLSLELLQGRRALSTVERSLETRRVVVSDLRAMGFTEDEIEHELLQHRFLETLNMIYEAVDTLSRSQAPDVEAKVSKLAEEGKLFEIELVKSFFCARNRRFNARD